MTDEKLQQVGELVVAPKDFVTLLIKPETLSSFNDLQLAAMIASLQGELNHRKEKA